MALQNPFPGLRPFSSDESHLFFGRERHLDEILRKLDVYHFVSIVGTSGSGKSSIIRAGLLPRMKHEESGWQIAVMRPGENPLHSLAEAISLVTDGASGFDENLQVLQRNPLGLVQLMRPLMRDGAKLLLLVDQFEEIFRYDTADSEENDSIRAHFVETLLRSVGQRDVPIHVILTLRSDFLGDCERYIGLPEAINDGQFLIPRMRRDELTKCITGPLGLSGTKIDPRLVQHLLDEIGNEHDRLPVLQHVLMRTWEVWREKNNPNDPIGIADYEATGGMDNALSIHAEEAYNELDTEKKKYIAEILFRTITLKGGDNRGIRRPTPVNEVASIVGVSEAQIIEVADIFRKQGRGFIMPPEVVPLNSNSILDISHESLMRVWRKLSDWVNEEAESAELYQRITNNALLYEQDKAGLWRDPDLQIALDWREKQHQNENWAKQYNEQYDLAQTFIDASYREKQYAIAELKRKRRIQQTAVIVFLLALSALSLWAFTERNTSRRYAQTALLEKQESERQKKLAEEQKRLAELNLDKAQAEEQKAQMQQKETEKQRNYALQSAEEAKRARELAEMAESEARKARDAAVADRSKADRQRVISDSLRMEAEKSEKKATKLQMLSLAQNLAIKSKLAQDYTFDQSVKGLLALKAYDLNKKYGGDHMDAEIFAALFSAYRLSQNKSDYMHRMHSDVVKSVEYIPGTMEFASVGNDGTLVLTNQTTTPLTSRKSTAIPLFLDNVNSNAAGTMVVANCENHHLQLFQITGNSLTQAPREIDIKHKGEIMDMVWNDDALYTASLDSTVKVVDMKNYAVKRTYHFGTRLLSLAVSDDGKLLLAGCENGNIYKLDPGKEGKPELIFKTDKGRIKALALNKQATEFAIGTGNGYSAVYSISNTDKPLSVLSGHKAGIEGIAFHPKSNLIATSSLDGVVRLWNVAELNPSPVEFREHDGWVMDVAFDSEGDKLISCGKDKTVRIYPVSIDLMASALRKQNNRSLTPEEWTKFAGEDVPFE
ncbi:MAG: hypothetical protein H6606_03900 [Flavobacteriales bacterium]|nr:hypothetical protein [Flavobacteriales bacterium]